MPRNFINSKRTASYDLRVGDTFIYHHQNEYEVVYLTADFVICVHLVNQRVIRLNRNMMSAPDWVNLFHVIPVGRFNPDGFESRFMIGKTENVIPLLITHNSQLISAG